MSSSSPGTSGLEWGTPLAVDIGCSSGSCGGGSFVVVVVGGGVGGDGVGVRGGGASCGPAD